MNAPTVMETVTIAMLGDQQRVWSNITHGWTFLSEREREDDVIKLYHSAIAPDGASHIINWSPYSVPDAEDQAMLVAIGFGRGPSGNWNKDHLRDAVARRYAA